MIRTMGVPYARWHDHDLPSERTEVFAVLRFEIVQVLEGGHSGERIAQAF